MDSTKCFITIISKEIKQRNVFIEFTNQLARSGSNVQEVVRFIFLNIDENAKNLIRECETKNAGADLEVVI